MIVYLVRHGEAANVSPDALRPLTKKGKGDVADLLKTLVEEKRVVDRIFHSPLLRAKETAEILKKSLLNSNCFAEGENLLPESDPKIWYEKLLNQSENIMLVGHMPYMGLLADYLMGDNKGRNFRTASVAMFENKGVGFREI